MKISNTLTIRPATLDDVLPLAELSHATVLELYPDIIGREAVEGYVASGAVLAYYTERNAWCWVAEMDGKPVGACALRDNTIDLMMVTLDLQRAGIGAELLADGEARLFAEHDRITLDSFRHNKQAVGFYAKHGWSVDHEFVDEEHGIEMICMFKLKD